MGNFAENLKRIRLDMKMSQEDFAQLLHTSKQNISRYEAGMVSPKISTAAKIAEILGISLSELNGEEETEPPIRQETVAAPRTLQARIVSAGMDNLPAEDRDKILAVLQAMYANHPDLFKRGYDDNDAQL